ncbi:hypothetical protein COMNV_01472 [Commensalibacter sp. Nvir]|uniref:DsbA family protein n=1 Tax=Commensalibacter sp. Nvir TaxID=3069817 RepID=UPI002D46C3EF|nr:hypothetical protein COMNV_01472 [Commensalibacter sp. Nvir]
MNKLLLKHCIRLPLACTLLSGIAVLPSISHAQNTQFTSDQQKEIVSVVRQALKDDPSILEDAIVSAQKQMAQERNEQASKTLTEKKNLLTSILPSDGFIGQPDAKNVIVEFYDPRCPYCKKVLPELIQLTKEDKNVKIIFKVVPILGENSILQAKAIAAAARQNGYVAMMKGLMDSKLNIDEETIKTIAKAQHLDPDRLLQDMKASSISKALDDNVELLKQLGIEGTPALIVNENKIVPGAVSYQTLKTLIQNNQ